MDFTTAQTWFNNLHARFPAWKPTPGEVDEWTKRLARLSDNNAIELAISDTYANTQYSKPTMKTFLEAYRQHSRGRDEMQQGGSQFTRYFIQCVQPPADCPTRAGWFIPVFSAEPDNQWHMIAENMRASHEAFYGGSWRTMNYTANDMTELQCCMTMGGERAVIRERFKLPEFNATFAQDVETLEFGS